jgi:hypothetical protein
MTERKITICGKEVTMIYCAATENGFEQISGKSIAVFVPTFENNDKGETVIKEPAKAMIGDYVMLAVAGIVASYTKKKEEPPISSDEILYEATPQDRNDMLAAVTELRNEWYGITAVVEETLKKEAQGQEGKEGGKKN